MGKKKNTGTVFTKEKLFALAEKYGLDYRQYECRDDLFDWVEGQDKILIYTSYLLRIGVRNVWEGQFEYSEEVYSMERLEAIVSYMVEMANGMKELNKKALALNLINDISKDF